MTQKELQGQDRQGNQRFKCAVCGQTFVEPTSRPLGNMRISMAQAVATIQLMVEGIFSYA